MKGFLSSFKNKPRPIEDVKEYYLENTIATASLIVAIIISLVLKNMGSFLLFTGLIFSFHSVFFRVWNKLLITIGRVLLVFGIFWCFCQGDTGTTLTWVGIFVVMLTSTYAYF